MTNAGGGGAGERSAPPADGLRRCRWCGRRFTANERGRPRQFCRPGCKQRDYESRQRSGELGLSEAELVVARHRLDDLHDRLYVLEAALEDVERDLAAATTERDVREALAWLIDAARPLTGSRLTDDEG